MEIIRFGYILLCLYSFVRTSAGSIWLQDPPSRSAAWNYGIQAAVNYNFRNLNCGGQPVTINADGSRNCGLCGDPINSTVPRPNENGGKYANPPILTRYYESGQHAEISIWNNVPGSAGFFEFRLCTNGENPTQKCLDENLLTLNDANKTYMQNPRQQGLNLIHVQLPAGVTCKHCLLQWRFRKEDSFIGCDASSWCGLGRGPQKEYYNCADIMIGAVGESKPDYIQDPTYTAADYGSAYDVATTLTTDVNGVTTPDNSGLAGTTTTTPTTTTTTRVPVFTVPTIPPVVTTSSPITTTTDAFGTAVPTTERLIVDANGNALGSVVNLGGATGTTNNNQLLILLGLLPLLGAVGLSNNNKPLPLAPQAPAGFWAPSVPLSDYYIGSGLDYGNFGLGSAPFSSDHNNGGYGGYGSESSSYGPKGRNYGTESRVASSLMGLNSGDMQRGVPYLNNLQNVNGLTGTETASLLESMVYSNGMVLNGRQAVQNTINGNYAKNNVVWGNGVTLNNGKYTHVYPRGISNNNAQYQHTPAQYSNNNGVQQLPNNLYHNNNRGNQNYLPHPQISYPNNNNYVPPNIPQPNPAPPVLHSTGWHNIGGQIPNTFNNQNNFNNIGNGQKFPPTQRINPGHMINVSPKAGPSQPKQGNPGLESVLRSRQAPPGVMTGLNPGSNWNNRNVPFMENNINQFGNGQNNNFNGPGNGFNNEIGANNGLPSSNNNNNNNNINNKRKPMVHDWYNQFVGTFRSSPTKPR